MMEVRMVKMTWIPKSLLRNSFNQEKRFYAVQHNIDAQKMQKETYNRKHLPYDLPIGAEVLVEHSR